MKRGLVAGVRLFDIHSGGTTIPFCVATKPVNPASNAHPNITASSLPIGLRRDSADSFGRDPTRAAIASKTTREDPIHQVANPPQPKANRVGDRVAKTGR